MPLSQSFLIPWLTSALSFWCLCRCSTTNFRLGWDRATEVDDQSMFNISPAATLSRFSLCELVHCLAGRTTRLAICLHTVPQLPLGPRPGIVEHSRDHPVEPWGQGRLSQKNFPTSSPSRHRPSQYPADILWAALPLVDDAHKYDHRCRVGWISFHPWKELIAIWPTSSVCGSRQKPPAADDSWG